jgi:glycosyltransferase involved in cell wall biosynthesis
MRLLMLSGDQQVAVGERGPFYTLLKEFREHFDGIDVLVTGQGRAATTTDPFDGVRFHVGPSGRFGRVAWLARQGVKLVNAYGHGLVLSHDYGLFHNGKAAARISAKAGIPWVSELHHVSGYPIAVNRRERFELMLSERFVRWATPRVDAFRVVNSTEMPPLLEGWGVPSQKIAVISSLYLDLDVFHPPAAPVEAQQDVIFVGRLVPNKGLDTIFSALTVLRDAGKPQRVLFVGRGPLARWLDKEIERVGLGKYTRRIDWVDGPEELADLYRSSRLLVCASTSEGGPRVPLEALACGIPVVSTPVGVMGEVLKDGAAGVLCEFTMSSLARSLALLLADESKRSAMGAAGPLIAARFERSAQIQRYAEGLKRIAGESA